MRLTVEIEDQKSWPPDFVTGVTTNRPLIIAYQRERSRIDRLCQDDVMARIHPPINKHKAAYADLVERLEQLLLLHRLVAFHCTRLTPQEVEEIKTGGLRLLTKDLVKRKLDRCHAHGHITRDTYEYLQASESIADNVGDVHAHRSGMIWFCPNRSTLRECSEVYRLFKSWGGEAIYSGHEQDANVSNVLTGIGIPCIVKCAIPFERAEQFYTNFTERFLSQYIAEEIEYPEPSAGFDLKTTRNLLASDVLDIIPFSDPRFEDLTQNSCWPVHYRIA